MYHAWSVERGAYKPRWHAGLALYQESENVLLYIAFVLGVTVCGGYFLHANFWFLDIMIGGVPLQVVIIAVGTAFVPSLMLPVLVRSAGQPRPIGSEPPTGQVWLNMMLIQQANLMLVMEELLFIGCAPVLRTPVPCAACVLPVCYDSLLSCDVV
jgi:hypothetical protein